MRNAISRIALGAIMLIIGIPTCVLIVIAQLAEKGARPYRDLDSLNHLVVRRPHILVYAPAKLIVWLVYVPTMAMICMLAVACRIGVALGITDSGLFS